MPELSPHAQAALSALSADPAAPIKLVITGGIGTGKSTTLAVARDMLRRNGVPATVVDDAQLLGDAELHALTELVADPTATVIIATEPREHRPELSSLMLGIEGEHPRIALGPWPRPEVGRRLSAADPDTLSEVMAVSAGLPFLVAAAANGRPVETALAERLRRLEPPVLATLLLMSLAPGLGPADVAAAANVPVPHAGNLVDQCYATGLLDPSLGPRFMTALHHCAALVTGATRHRELESTLLRAQLEKSTLSTDLALALAEHGLHDEHLVGVLEKRARATDEPAQTARLLLAARSAGAGGAEFEVRLAESLARAGDCARAAALTDGLLDRGDPAQRGTAVRIAASVAMHDGNAGQAADLVCWSLAESATDGGRPDAAATAAGVIALVAAGMAEQARQLAARPATGPPTSAARSLRNLSEGIAMTLDHPYAETSARLGQALGPASGSGAALPDSAPALVTLAALHAGDAMRARTVIARAVEQSAGDAVLGPRHRLLQAWVRLQDGQLAAAAVETAAAVEAGRALHRREALWAAALRAGIARRSGDTGALQQHWFGALEVLAEYSVDLFSLLPLGELWICAQRLHQGDRIRYAVDQGFALLESLGNPPAWSLPLHWAGVHAAMLAGSPESMAPHGQALATAAAHSGFAAALAGAGRAWLRVLAQQVAADEVGHAARGLAGYGLTWDATRLAGQAALHAADPRVSGSMLQIARDLRPDSLEPAHPPPVGTTVVPGRALLSEREREVAELLLLGMPYRDIGAQLFISAKTVEHHVARIRRRLGADSRSEMLSMLRVMLMPDAAART